MAGEAIQVGEVVGELLGGGEGGFGLGLEGGEGESEGADLEGAEVVVGDAGAGLGGEASGGGGGVEFDEGWKRSGWGMIVAGVVAGLAAVLGEEGLAEGDGLGREIEDFAFLKGGGNATGVEVGGDVSGLGGAKVLSRHSAAGAGGEGVEEEGGEGRVGVVVGEGDRRGGEGGGFEVGFRRKAGGAVVGAGFVASDAAEGVVEGFAVGGIARGWGGEREGEGGEVGGDGLDGVGIGFQVAGEKAGHLSAGFAMLGAADEAPEGVDVEPRTDAREIGSGFGANQGGPDVGGRVA